MDRVALSDIGRANNRIVRVTNAHFYATTKDVEHFFKGLTVVDHIRDQNVRSRRDSIIYVMFATVKERMVAEGLSNRHLRSRVVKIQPAPIGPYQRKSSPSVNLHSTNKLVVKDDISGFVYKDDISPESSEMPEAAVPQMDENHFPALGNPVRIIDSPKPETSSTASESVVPPSAEREPAQDDPTSRLLLVVEIPLDVTREELAVMLSQYHPTALTLVTNPEHSGLHYAWVLVSSSKYRDRAIEQYAYKTPRGLTLIAIKPPRIQRGKCHSQGWPS